MKNDYPDLLRLYSINCPSFSHGWYDFSVVLDAIVLVEVFDELISF